MNRRTPFRTAPVLAPNLISRSPFRRSFSVVLLALALALLAVPQRAPAVTPPPDGGYPNNNTAEGDNALLKLTTGDDNTAIGFDALRSNTSGIFNTATGSGALRNNTGGNYNTANGFFALFYSTGTYNTATGAYALFGCMSESCSISTGFGNTATGVYALTGNTTGNQNTATGFHALGSNANADNNTATGVEALLFNTTGNNNTATGVDALRNNEVGRNNTATGFNALSQNTTGNTNTADGFRALFSNTTGIRNIALGFNAGFNLTTGSDNIDIGALGLAGESGKIRIGTQGTQTATFIAGIRGVTVAGGVGVIVGSNGQLGTVTSSARFKEAIKPMEKASEAILALKPVTFRYKQELDPDAIPQFGLVAEQVEKVDPDLVVRDEDGKVSTVRYEAVNAMLLNEFLKEHRKVETLEGIVTQQQKQIEALTATVQKVSDQIALSKRVPQLVANP